MCYKSSLIVDLEFLEERYQVKRSPKLKKDPARFQSYHFNGFNHPDMLIIPQQRPEVITDAIWGIMPTNQRVADKEEYYKEVSRYGAGLNARSEKAFDHFIYRTSIFEKRCIVPFSGFFEPHKGKDGKSYPFYFKDKHEDVLSIAGLYSITADRGVTFALLTKPASPLFERIHNVKKRQIILLDKEREKEWLNPDLSQTQIKEIFDYPYDDDSLITYPVTQEINSRKYHLDNPEVIQPVEYTNII